MVLNERKELHRRHLEWNRNILVGVHHDHIILLVDDIQIGASVIGNDRNVLGKMKIAVGKIGNLLIDLDTGEMNSFKIPSALCGEGSGSHSEDKCVDGLLFHQPGHHRSSHCVVVIGTGQVTLLLVNRLYPEQNVCGKGNLIIVLIHLKVVVNRFPLVGQVLIPEGKAVIVSEDAAYKKDNDGNRHFLHLLKGDV